MAWDIQSSADDLTLLMEAGFIYRYSRRFGEARTVFTGVRALLPQNEVPEIALGTVSFEEGNFAEAIRHYNRAIEINPRSAYAHAQLGEAQLFQGDWERARLSLRRALELNPAGEFGNLAKAVLAFLQKIERANQRPTAGETRAESH